MSVHNLIDRSIRGTQQQRRIYVNPNMSLQDEVDKAQGSRFFTTFVLGKGEHNTDREGDPLVSLVIRYFVNIEGDPGVARKDIVVMGGINILKEIQGICNLKHLIVQQATTCGVKACSSFTMEDVLVSNCNWHGIHADGTGVVGRCTDVEVHNCLGNGVSVEHGASITLRTSVYDIAQTYNNHTVHHNTPNMDNLMYGNSMYGLKVYGSSATIHLVSPLTKEIVSINNNGGHNWGAEQGGDINQIKNLTKANDKSLVQAMGSILAGGKVRVPEDCKTLKEAVEWVNREHRLTTIIVGKPELPNEVHTTSAFAGDYLQIFSAMNIVGDPDVAREDIVIKGGIYVYGGIQGNCHLQHLTLRDAEKCGVNGFSSFTMDDVLVEQCNSYGVRAVGKGVVARCTNVEVQDCKGSGVNAVNGASITLIGAKTTVRDNCTKSDTYGLDVSGLDSTIELISSWNNNMTKEQVSWNDNFRGRNWHTKGGGVIIQTQKRDRDGDEGNPGETKNNNKRSKNTAKQFKILRFG